MAPRKWPPWPTSGVGVEGQRPLVDLERRELGLQHLQDLDVDDELLVAGDQAALEPARGVHHPVGSGENVGSIVIRAS
jgi:hypothetical protein